MNPTKNYKLRFDKMSNSGTGKFRPNKFINNSITKLVKLQILYLLKSVSLTVKFFSCESIINFWNYKVLIQIVSAMVRWSTEYCRCDLNMLIVFCILSQPTSDNTAHGWGRKLSNFSSSSHLVRAREQAI